jgi:hypothetical protein
VSTIHQRRKKGSTREPYHEGKRRTASAGDPRHGRSMACTTVYTHISLLTSKGLAQRGEWRQRMGEKEVRNEWPQYGPRTVTSKARKTTHDIRTRCNVAGLLKMWSVQPHAIAYTAVQVRVQLYCMPMETNGRGSFISHCRATLPGVSRTTILTMKYSTII